MSSLNGRITIVYSDVIHHMKVDDVMISNYCTIKQVNSLILIAFKYKITIHNNNIHEYCYTV